MSIIKKIISAFIVVAILWTIWGRIRGGDSQEVTNTKIACDVEKNEDGNWVLRNLFDVFPDFKINEIQGKSGDAYPEVLAYLGAQSAAAAGAAQLNERWRTLADATSDFVYSIQMSLAIASANDIGSETDAEVAKLRLISSIKKSSECQAFINRLNS